MLFLTGITPIIWLVILKKALNKSYSYQILLIKQSFDFLRGRPRATRFEGDHLATKILAGITRIYNYYHSSLINNNFGIIFRDKHVEMNSCLCILIIDCKRIQATIVHTQRGKFKILDDSLGGKYIDRIVDASDVIRCVL